MQKEVPRIVTADRTHCFEHHETRMEEIQIVFYNTPVLRNV